jgi:hypothetical protein
MKAPIYLSILTSVGLSVGAAAATKPPEVPFNPPMMEYTAPYSCSPTIDTQIIIQYPGGLPQVQFYQINSVFSNGLGTPTATMQQTLWSNFSMVVDCSAIAETIRKPASAYFGTVMIIVPNLSGLLPVLSVTAVYTSRNNKSFPPNVVPIQGQQING